MGRGSSGLKGPCPPEHSVTGLPRKGVLTPGRGASLAAPAVFGLSQSSGPLPKSPPVTTAGGLLVLRKSRNIPPELSVQAQHGFSFLGIHPSRVCDCPKVETTSMSNNRKPATFIRVSLCQRILIRKVGKNIRSSNRLSYSIQGLLFSLFPHPYPHPTSNSSPTVCSVAKENWKQ